MTVDGKRRALVIGSQCEALWHLDCISLADELYSLLIDPTCGGCSPALDDGIGLLSNPTVDETYDSLERAVRRANNEEATLIICYLGHGDAVAKEFYLLPFNAVCPPNFRRAVDITKQIKDLLNSYQQLDGLILLVDSCASGEAAVQGAAVWSEILNRTRGRLELVTAADGRDAFDGCFTRTVIRLLQQGNPAGAAFLYGADAQREAITSCPNQVS